MRSYNYIFLLWSFVLSSPYRKDTGPVSQPEVMLQQDTLSQ